MVSFELGHYRSGYSMINTLINDRSNIPQVRNEKNDRQATVHPSACTCRTDPAQQSQKSAESSTTHQPSTSPFHAVYNRCTI